jgi:C-lobe and N-lobe beta barrels of Tf-binding protein B
LNVEYLGLWELIMRFVSVSALVLTGFALSACTGAGDTTCGTIDILPTGPCVAAGGATSSGSGSGTGTAPTGAVGTSAGGGNTTTIAAATGSATLAFEGAGLSLPTTGTALSNLAIDPFTLPTTQKFLIDSKTSTNSYWATPVTMDEYVPGTNATGPGNNGGAGTNYREYRALSKTAQRDEVLQVWKWSDSYAAQYVNQSGGGEGRQHAWMFGGNKTATMPVGGLATYNGRFVAVAKTENYIKGSNADVDPNALWRVQGASTLTADFNAAQSITGTLTPETWTSFQTFVPGDYTKTVGSAGTASAPDYTFYNTTVALKGTITGNTYAGTSKLSGNFVSADNPMYGGFFGPSARQTTGVFSVYGDDPAPMGGSAGNTDARHGYLTIDGAFNACDTAATCP